MCKEIPDCTSHPTKDSVRNVLEYFVIVHISSITKTQRHAQNRMKSVDDGLLDRPPITFANHYIALSVTRM